MTSKKSSKKKLGVTITENGLEIRIVTLRLTPDEWRQVDTSWLGRNGLEAMLQELLRIGVQSASNAQALFDSPQPGVDALKIIGESFVKTLSERVTINLPPKVQKGIEVASNILSIFTPKK